MRTTIRMSFSDAGRSEPSSSSTSPAVAVVFDNDTFSLRSVREHATKLRFRRQQPGLHHIRFAEIFMTADIISMELVGELDGYRLAGRLIQRALRNQSQQDRTPIVENIGTHVRSGISQQIPNLNVACDPAVPMKVDCKAPIPPCSSGEPLRNRA